MKIKKLIKGSLGIVVLVVLLYTSYNAVIGFYSGFHNLDSSFNYLGLGLETDINTDGMVRSLKDTYLIGLSQMKNSFLWMTFDIILGVILGYLVRGYRNENN